MSSMRIGVKQALASIRMDVCTRAGWKITILSCTVNYMALNTMALVFLTSSTAPGGYPVALSVPAVSQRLKTLSMCLFLGAWMKTLTFSSRVLK